MIKRGVILNKKAQMTIFIIVALIIVSVIVVVFLFVPGISGRGQEVNPTVFLSNCIEPEIDDAIEILRDQGGSLEPDSFITFNDMNIQYLCYTSTDFEPCIVQQPLLKAHVESEIESYVTPTARDCISDLASEYRQRGFTVTHDPGDVEVMIEPGEIAVDFNAPMTITKEGTQVFNSFGVSKKSEMYDLLLIATDIISTESLVGDVETTSYTDAYQDLLIEKLNIDDGDTVFILRNVVTDEYFTFASRSQIWPQGYGVDL